MAERAVCEFVVEFVPDALADAFAEEPKLASYLHLPVQSGSDRILGAMKRGYTRAQYLEKIRRVREARPSLSLSTDIIIGFPGESEDDFAATLEACELAGFDFAYSFNYSPRPGTPAANLKDNVPPEVKDRRLALLQARIKQQDDAYKRSMVGTTQRVLVERASKRGGGQVAGRAANNRTVNFNGEVSLISQLVDVRITQAMNNSLQGELV